jgi:hypothetical protein
VRSLPSRAAVVTSAAGVLLLSVAGPASAHVEAEVSEGARAGGDPVTVDFSAEAERPSAGIAAVKTQLPAGVLPEWVSLESGPAGWTLATTADGYTVTGPALAPGTDAKYTIRIGQLPADTTTYAFKTLVDYTDGSEDAWIEDTPAGGPEPDHPAPVVTVAAAPSTSSAASSGSSSGSSSAASDPTTPAATPASPQPAAASSDSGSSTGAVVGTVVAVVAVALVAVAVVLRMRRRSA